MPLLTRSALDRLLAPSLACALLVPRVAWAEPYSVSFRSSPANLAIYERTGETTERPPLERGVVVSVPAYSPVCSATPCEAPLSLGTHTLGVGSPGGSIAEVSEPVRIDGPTNVEVTLKDRSGRRTAGWISMGLGMGTGLIVLLNGLSNSSAFHSPGNPETISGAVVMGLSLVALGLVFQWDEVQVVVTPVLLATPTAKEAGPAYPPGLGALIRF
jgi:hypothetical protein